MRGDTTDFGPIPGAAEEGPRRSRIGTSRLPWWGRGWIGLLLLALFVLPWLPISWPPGDATPARRVRGVGDPAILTFAFAPHGETIATLQTDGRVALRDVAGGAGPTPSWTTAASPWPWLSRPTAGRWPWAAPNPISSCTTSRPAGRGVPWGCRSGMARAWPSRPTAAPWPRRATSITRSSSGTSRGGGPG